VKRDADADRNDFSNSTAIGRVAGVRHLRDQQVQSAVTQQCHHAFKSLGVGVFQASTTSTRVSYAGANTDPRPSPIAAMFARLFKDVVGVPMVRPTWPSCGPGKSVRRVVGKPVVHPDARLQSDRLKIDAT